MKKTILVELGRATIFGDISKNECFELIAVLGKQEIEQEILEKFVSGEYYIPLDTEPHSKSKVIPIIEIYYSNCLLAKGVAYDIVDNTGLAGKGVIITEIIENSSKYSRVVKFMVNRIIMLNDSFIYSQNENKTENRQYWRCNYYENGICIGGGRYTMQFTHDNDGEPQFTGVFGIVFEDITPREETLQNQIREELIS